MAQAAASRGRQVSTQNCSTVQSRVYSIATFRGWHGAAATKGVVVVDFPAGFHTLSGRATQFGVQQVEERLKGLRNYVRICQDGHEIGVAVPARHEMPMQVAGHSGPGDFAEVQADVETIAVYQSLKCTGQSRDCLHNFQVLVGRQLVETRLVQSRGNKQVAVGIRVAIEHDHRCRPAPNGEGAVLIWIGRRAAEEAVGAGAIRPGEIGLRSIDLRVANDVAQTPGRPELLS